ncbi:MAG: hypothetical protein BGO70_09955 [Bacteroidetes bacterium 43-93]|nr:hypothetical protein [Bacteroidota bacterium]OJX00481.1 MAG: hypothetical protein BGO70_09955 [Bacteroidetes bacterium 43-93]
MPKTTTVTTLITNEDGEIECFLTNKHQIFVGINCEHHQVMNSASIVLNLEDARELQEELDIAIARLEEYENADETEEEEYDDEEEEEDDEIYEVYPGKKE